MSLPLTARSGPVRAVFRRSFLVTVLAFSVIACASTPAPRDARVADDEVQGDAITDEGYLPDYVATSILVGSALLESGDVRGALPYYAYAFDQIPEDLEIGRRYVEVALRAGRGPEALAALDQILLHHPDELDLAVQRVRILAMLGEVDLAEQESVALLEAHPDDIETLDLRSDLLLGARDWAAALPIVERMIELRPDEASLWSRKAALLQALDRETEAEQAWRRTLDLDPSDTEAVDRLSDLLRAEGRTEELITLLEDLLARTDLGPLVQARLADLYLAKGELERTVELLMPLAEGGDLEPRARMILADLLVNLGRSDEALRTLDELEAAGGEGLPLDRARGELLLEMDRYDEAEAAFDAAIAADPDDADGYVGLALAMSQRDPSILRGEGDPARVARFGELLSAAEQRISAESLRQNYLLGAMLRRAGEYERAKAPLRRASALGPENRQVLYELAVAQEGSKDYRAAAATLDRLLEIDPEDAHLQNFYGYLLADQGWELEKAERLIRSAVEQEPDNGAYVDSLGWVLYRQGQLEAALEQLIRAANLVGDDPVVLEHLGDCLRDLGRAEEALRTYRRALQIGGETERLQPRIDAVEESLREAP